MRKGKFLWILPFFMPYNNDIAWNNIMEIYFWL